MEACRERVLNSGLRSLAPDIYQTAGSEAMILNAILERLIPKQEKCYNLIHGLPCIISYRNISYRIVSYRIELQYNKRRHG